MKNELIPSAPTHPIERPGKLATQPFDAALLAGQLAPSSIAMYQRDFMAYVQFAGGVDAMLDAATLALAHAPRSGDNNEPQYHQQNVERSQASDAGSGSARLYLARNRCSV